MSSYFKAPVNNGRNPLFQFQGFEMYAARREDLWLAMLWTGMDEHHRDKIDPLFWVEASAGVETYLMADRSGFVFFFRLNRCVMCVGDESVPHQMVRVHIQFAPVKPTDPPACVPLTTEARRKAAMPVDRVRTMRALVLGCEWMQRAMEPLGISALCFESESPTLIRFCQKHMGFRREGMWLIKWFHRQDQPQGASGTQEKSGDYSSVQRERA